VPSVSPEPGQRHGHAAELLQRQFQVLDDLGGDLVERREAARIDVAVVLEPEEVEVRLVVGGERLVAELAESLALLASDEVVRVGADG